MQIHDLPDGQLADLITVAICPPPPDGAAESDSDAAFRARVGIAADAVARRADVRDQLRQAPNLEAQLDIVGSEVKRAVEMLKDAENPSGFVAAGAVGDFLRNLRERVAESVSRTAGRPGAALTILASELRPKFNDVVTRFLGDILCYIARRGTPDAPGPIPSVLIKALETAHEYKKERDEPIVLLTHSMGGQIAYDVLTSFLPARKSPVMVDFWCATASQVGFFEELNMFLASSDDHSKATGKRTPFPAAHLDKWWNVWDHNDIISFTTGRIFSEGIDDEEYWTGMSVAGAHGGYLERPSFYRRFAEKLESAFAEDR